MSPTSSETTAPKYSRLVAGLARELVDLYRSGTTCLFILHGNVHDLIHCCEGAADSYLNLTEFLATQIFCDWDMVLGFELSEGLRAQAGGDSKRLGAMQQQLAARWGERGQLAPRRRRRALAARRIDRAEPGRFVVGEEGRHALPLCRVSRPRRRLGHPGPRAGGPPGPLLALGPEPDDQAGATWRFA